MKFTADRHQFAAAIAYAARILPARPSAPILAGMLLHLDDDGQLTVSAFDYEKSASSTLEVSSGEPGTVLLSGRLLGEITKALPDKPVTVTEDGTRATLTCGASVFTLVLMPSGEYPALPGMPDLAGSVDAAEFAHAVAQVAVAAGRDDTLPVLTGVKVIADRDAGLLTLVATDRYRLAVRGVPYEPSGAQRDLELLIPAHALTDVAKHLDGDRVSLSADDGTVGFSGSGLAVHRPRARQESTRSGRSCSRRSSPSPPRFPPRRSRRRSSAWLCARSGTRRSGWRSTAAR